jgi:hypothetical protein
MSELKIIRLLAIIGQCCGFYLMYAHVGLYGALGVALFCWGYQLQNKITGMKEQP